jgi:phage tail tape-measure protein
VAPNDESVDVLRHGVLDDGSGGATEWSRPPRPGRRRPPRTSTRPRPRHPRPSRSSSRATRPPAARRSRAHEVEHVTQHDLCVTVGRCWVGQGLLGASRTVVR